MAKGTIISARRSRRTKTVAERRVTRRVVQSGEAAKRKLGKSSAGTSTRRAPAARRETKAVLTPPTPLHFERVTGKIKLTPPPGYMLSVLLKLTGRNEANRNIYVWWLSVGRDSLDAFTVPFDVNGADIIRCDVPDNFDFSSDQIEQGLVAIRKNDKGEQTKLITGDPPVVHGPGGNR